MRDDWRGDLEVWLAPFLAALRHKTRIRLSERGSRLAYRGVRMSIGQVSDLYSRKLRLEGGANTTYRMMLPCLPN